MTPTHPNKENLPLKGLRVAPQAHLAVAGWPADAGSRALDGYIASEDATVIHRLREAGATLHDYTRMSAFGLGLHGSCAGTALREQSVAAELVPDMMGEGRLAAARAGVCALKPSYGVLSRAGVTELIPSMASCTLLAGEPPLLRNLLHALAGADERDVSMCDEPLLPHNGSAVEPAAVTLGLLDEASAGLSAAHAAAFAARVAHLQEAGVVISRLSFPEWSLFRLVHQIVGAVEASSATGRYDSVRYGARPAGAKNWNEMYLKARGAAFEPLVKSFLFQGAYFQFERYPAYEDACRIRARLVKAMTELTTHVDALLLPLPLTPPTEVALSLDETYALFDVTLFANVTGQPVLTLPPVQKMAVQLAGARLSDDRLLARGETLLKIWQKEACHGV